MAIKKSGISGIPFGNTASRPASPSLGQPYFNGEVGRLELYSSNGWQNIVQETPGVSSASGTYSQSTGSGTFTVAGTNFVDGAIAYAVGTNGTEYQATTTTYNSLVQLTVLFSSLSAAYEPYDIKIVNPSNLFGLLPDAFYINDSPVWSTSSGSLGTYTGSSIQLAATDDESNTITYSVTSGSLPTGVSLSSSGLISGTSTSSGTFTFTVSASDGINTAVTRSFSIIVYPTVTGGTLSSDSTYYYRTFTGSGTLSVSNDPVSLECLVIGGGGAGGYTTSGWSGGGGGSGGAVYHSGLSFATGNYTVTIGQGGPGPSSGQASNQAPNGSDSSLSTNSTTITGYGGGGGAGYNSAYATGGTGGSGGGGEHTAGTSIATQGAGGTAAYGNIGGAGNQGINSGGGGGLGSSGQTSTPGNGGAGLNTWSTWASATSTGVSGFFGGGGGGGTDILENNGGAGGSGGGGAGGNGNGSSGQSGSVNTGSGGGGRGSYRRGSGIGGSGGSGIVIVRYTKTSVGG